ncbi:hypothetical protein V0288_02770 [Pannus brasiliensis CCIBt3594]|uniref:Uncharacterized protein n=1 Tax=Pannus brasiliensis CCIBt3594 TaxID=1427578 RepID=A0AAW9QMR9_9CHRO
MKRRVFTRGSIGLLVAISISALGSRVDSQTLRPEAAAKKVYEQVPNIPRENTYTRKETGAIDPENTLISRLIRYHQDVKKRFTTTRLDWQLTLADYLGANEVIVEERYPGQNTLTVNPMKSDVKAIQSLNRRQREAIVTALVILYNPVENTPPTPTPQPSPSPSPSPLPSPRTPSLSKPGDANLLK